MLALLLFTAGCDNQETPPAPPPEKPAQTKTDVKPEVKPESKPEVTKPTPEPEKPAPAPEKKTVVENPSAKSMNVKVYYPDDSGMRLVEVEREIIIDDSTDKYPSSGT